MTEVPSRPASAARHSNAQARLEAFVSTAFRSESRAAGNPTSHILHIYISIPTFASGLCRTDGYSNNLFGEVR